MGNQQSSGNGKIGVKGLPAKFSDDINSKTSKTNWTAGKCQWDFFERLGQLFCLHDFNPLFIPLIYSKVSWNSFLNINYRNLEIFWKCKSNKEKITIFQFSSWNFFFELKGKGHEPSRAKLKKLQLEPVWLGLITTH